MASLIPGYEYDIFISYRHNDNRSGWVTDFVKNLQEELAAVLKDPVSVYFDSNPHDGLLENHDVDESLAGRLRSLIFIPIISQTYCDEKSFAWQHEFLVFKNAALSDPIGIRIRLGSGNVASRILPVRIYELDADDKHKFENELGPLRAIDFIFSAPGVNRPLTAREDQPQRNLRGIYYRDQINKVANAIKEIILGLNGPIRPVSAEAPAHAVFRPRFKNSKIAILVAIFIAITVAAILVPRLMGGNKPSGKSIAVLPFINMSGDPDQGYFSDGITEDILNHLVKISELKVKSRTSTIQYKGSTMTIPEIGEELGVSAIVEGSVRRADNRVKVVVKLVDVKNDVQLWSETYDRELKDIFMIQSEIAMRVAQSLKVNLTRSEEQNINKENATSITAYDYYLKGLQNHEFGNYTRLELDAALALYKRSVETDSSFAPAYLKAGQMYFHEMPRFGLAPAFLVDTALALANRAIHFDPTFAGGYVLRGWINFRTDNKKQFKEDHETALRLAPNDPEVLNGIGWNYYHHSDDPEEVLKGCRMIIEALDRTHSKKDPRLYDHLGSFYEMANANEEAISLFKRSQQLDPASIVPDSYLSWLYLKTGKYAEGIEAERKNLAVEPLYTAGIDNMAWLNLLSGNLDEAERYWSKYEEIEATFPDTSMYVSFRHRVAYVKWLKGDKQNAMKLFDDHLKLTMRALKHDQRAIRLRHYDAACINAFLGNKDLAIAYLDTASTRSGFDTWYIQHDPLIAGIRDDDRVKRIVEDFQKRKRIREEAMLQALEEYLEKISFAETFNR